MNKTPTLYKGASQAAPSKRIFSSLLDKFFVILLSVLLGIVSVNFILPNIPVVKDAQNKTEAYYVECLNEYEASKLRGIDHSTNPGNLENLSVTFKNYASRHIDNTVTVENDNFAYFYLTYRKNNNMGTSEQYNLNYMNKEILKLPTAPSDYEGNVWSYTSIDELVTFKDDVKANLKLYFDGTVNDDTQKTYNTVYAEFEKIYVLADKEFTTSEKSPFFNKYSAYTNEGYTFINYGVLTIFICFTLSFALLYIPLSMATKGGKTLGKLIFKLALVNEDETNLSWPQKLLRIFIQYVESLWALMIICGFFSSAMITNPIFVIGGFTFSLLWVILLSILLEITSLVLLMLHKKRLPLHDLIFKTTVVDITTTMDVLTINENKEDKENDKDKENKDEWSLDNYQEDNNAKDNNETENKDNKDQE